GPRSVIQYRPYRLDGHGPPRGKPLDGTFEGLNMPVVERHSRIAYHLHLTRPRCPQLGPEHPPCRATYSKLRRTIGTDNPGKPSGPGNVNDVTFNQFWSISAIIVFHQYTYRIPVDVARRE